MSLWFFKEIRDFRPEVGFSTQFTVEVGHTITYNWKYAGYPGDSLLTMQLTSAGAGTRLRLEHRITEDFPDDVPEFTRESCLAGWIDGGLQRVAFFMHHPDEQHSPTLVTHFAWLLAERTGIAVTIPKLITEPPSLFES